VKVPNHLPWSGRGHLLSSHFGWLVRGRSRRRPKPDVLNPISQPQKVDEDGDGCVNADEFSLMFDRGRYAPEK
jgi:hypothetical protein